MSLKVRVWDLPTRIFHWSLVICVIGLIISGQIGGAAMAWHFRLGYAVLSLLLFRLVWGLVGGYWSRFRTFIYSPATLLRYLRGQGQPELSVGHTPLGAGSVFAMLFFLLAQVATGLISDDEIASSGPLTPYVSNSLVSLASSYHKDVGKLILIGLITLHVSAISFYYFKKRDNLIKPMIDGDKELDLVPPASRDDARSRTVAALLFAVCAGLVIAMVKIAG